MHCRDNKAVQGRETYKLILIIMLNLFLAKINLKIDNSQLFVWVSIIDLKVRS